MSTAPYRTILLIDDDAEDQEIFIEAMKEVFPDIRCICQDVLLRVVSRATEQNTRSVLVTFEPHPLEIVNPAAAPPLLTLPSERIEVLAESGIDYVAVLPFTRDLASWEAERFVSELLVGRYRVAHLMMGHDHGFGRNRAGDPDVLRALGARLGFSVEVLPPVTSANGQPISSTSIRRALAGGDLARAKEGLGRDYSLSGLVVPGDQRGRLLGYPTINLGATSSRKLLPPEGVYAVRVQTPQGPFGGMLNLGPRPTFGDASTSVEAHLFDASSDFYRANVRIDFVARLRDTQKFDGVDALVAQLRLDEAAARQLLAS